MGFAHSILLNVLLDPRIALLKERALTIRKRADLE